MSLNSESISHCMEHPETTRRNQQTDKQSKQPNCQWNDQKLSKQQSNKTTHQSNNQANNKTRNQPASQPTNQPQWRKPNQKKNKTSYPIFGSLVSRKQVRRLKEWQRPAAAGPLAFCPGARPEWFGSSNQTCKAKTRPAAKPAKANGFLSHRKLFFGKDFFPKRQGTQAFPNRPTSKWSGR